MRYSAALVLLTIMRAGMAAAVCSTAASADSNEATTTANIPVPRLQTTIELSSLVGPASLVKKMAFSPDGRFLAIVINPTFGKTDIVVWDLRLNREQSHIHCSSDYGDLYYQDLLWWPDGRVISFGIKQQWDPMSGNALPDNPAVGRAARLNKDGSKMLTIAGSITRPSYINIYNTTTWELQKLYVDGFIVETAAWTAENKIMVDVHQTKDTIGQTIDNYTIAHGADEALRLIDPEGKEPTKALWFTAVPDNRWGHVPWNRAVDITLGPTDLSRNQIALGADRIINGTTMEIITYESVSAGIGGKVFTNDGKFLVLQFIPNLNIERTGSIVFIQTLNGKKISEIRGGIMGIAISPDSKTMAVGNGRSVELFALN